MAKPLLRSGRTDEFCALGENGQRIIELAQQIRETLRLRKQHELFHSLAVPQINETNQRIHWYAPHQGEVVPWAAASPDQQRAALACLERCATALTTLAQQFRQSQDSVAQLLAALLPNILHFPGSQFVYLVEGVPVITFWGSLPFDRSPEEEPLAPLRAALKTEPAPVITGCEPLLPHREESEQEAVVVALAHHPADEKLTPPESPAAGRARLPLVRRILTGSLLVACGALVFWPRLTARLPTALTRPAIVVPSPEPASTASVQILSQLNKVQLPLADAGLAQPDRAPAPHTEEREPTDALALPVQDLRTGSTRFFNGRWQLTPRQRGTDFHTISTFYITITPASSLAQLTTISQVSCQSGIRFGLMQSGNLIVKSHGKAKCTDGSRLTVPDVICNRNADGITLCNADFGDGLPVAITVRKVKK
ncbi:SrfA family protein [Pantoea sp. KPR_PJ]|uniref:SrfA family protein n=1 Tax=Pantoea sp. KPR_PJ TaxID=2738375 RepID=UPI003527ADC6